MSNSLFLLLSIGTIILVFYYVIHYKNSIHDFTTQHQSFLHNLGYLLIVIALFIGITSNSGKDILTFGRNFMRI